MEISEEQSILALFEAEDIANAFKKNRLVVELTYRDKIDI